MGVSASIQKLFVIQQVIDELVRAAERIFPEKGSGVLKKAWVQKVLIFALTILKDADLPLDDRYEFLLDRLIELAVRRLQEYGAIAPAPVPTPEPPPPPPVEDTRYERELTTEPHWGIYEDGDRAYTDNATEPTVWWVVPAGKTPQLMTYIRVKYGIVADGQLVKLV